MFIRSFLLSKLFEEKKKAEKKKSAQKQFNPVLVALLIYLISTN
jgi:hypothetical protein